MLLAQIIFASAVVSAISFVGIFSVYRKPNVTRHTMKLIISLAAGSLLAVSFLDLIPEAIEHNGNAKPILLTILASFLVFFILEKYWHWHHCRCVDCKPNDPRLKNNIIYTNLIGDGIHNLTDGFLIATAFMLDTTTGIIATLVVILHEIPQEISDFGILLYAGLSKAKAVFFNFLFALTAMVGGIAFYFFGQAFSNFIPFMAAFAAGNFIYLATADLIPELHHEDNPKRVLLHTMWLLIGVLVIFLLNLIHPEFE